MSRLLRLTGSHNSIGETPRAMPAEIHFGTFVAALMETLEYRIEGAPPV